LPLHFLLTVLVKFLDIAVATHSSTMALVASGKSCKLYLAALFGFTH